MGSDSRRSHTKLETIERSMYDSAMASKGELWSEWSILRAPVRTDNGGSITF